MTERLVYCVKLQKDAPGIDEDDLQGGVALEMVESMGGANIRQRIHGGLGIVERLPDDDLKRVPPECHGPAGR